MSAPPGKFDEAAYRGDAAEYLKYLKCVWKLSVEQAEECIAPPAQPDDAEAVDNRRAVIYDLAARFFDKLVLDVRDIAAQEYWIKQMEGEK